MTGRDSRSAPGSVMLPSFRFSILEFLWLGATLSVSFGAFYRLAEGGGIVAWVLTGAIIVFVVRGTREGISPGVRAAVCMTAGGVGGAFGAMLSGPSLHPLPMVVVGLATGVSYGLLIARRQAVAWGQRLSWGDYARVYVGSVLIGSLFCATLPFVPSLPVRFAIGVVFGLLAGTAISGTVYLGSRFASPREEASGAE